MVALQPRNRNASQFNKPAPRRSRNAGAVGDDAEGCSPDNAAAEGFFGRLKQEFFHRRSFAGVSMDGFINMLNDYMVWYRDKRIKT